MIPLWNDVFQHDGISVNYGLNRLRFPSPVPVGSRIRASFLVDSVEELSGGIQAAIEATVEREGEEKPALVAELLLRLLN